MNTYNRKSMKVWAQNVLASNPLIIDTETTGLTERDEICEIAAIDSNGAVFLNTLIKPIDAIPVEVIDIHGITNEAVADAPTWEQLHADIQELISGRLLAVYNADFDLRMMEQSALFSGRVFPMPLTVSCVMKAYARYVGEWCERRKNYRWHKLTAAAEQMGVTIDGMPHRALFDCLLTLGLLRKMAGYDD
ncbi:3'-5' exonuclease [Enterovibrio paralichthyis]|uniref:3'-5' exonuclease n=1 Tax=Enterovibrio paralichthyis TaxID=2853805 RepID=UPI001C486823|nr:3'-5' exonuclease [Enterovibrio paralichthyis]MBV7296834.1 3'-5' exonuclease [Enterovibrio paralichthyis]